MSTATAVTGVRGTPVRQLTVLYDAQCSLCVHVRHWLQRQPQLVPLRLVPAGSDEAHRVYPEIDHGDTLREITVIGDRGQVYRGEAAWIMCLWALAEYRAKAKWLATPAGKPFVRVTLLAAAKYRERSGARRLERGPAPCADGCDVPH
ncbi:thiol-disulfide oxidoreductase DCC family protein [Streptomyces yaizuensis]|uniref:DCC1-like thiol-disulfide oxidoreductase family protein n=1 Tax=Streptomyces yaizuensis TaxID=2989713 RepID=A0ABQ5P523_9ACTN|nr:DCC1-like thiol-disulfide oxidoreductase family protein [Streptomyces sp. YSPA8]GLF97696.1 DCC1-like thiol-disulfide oxidoreductase family protein [Streptomyces sp. YSPA8]